MCQFSCTFKWIDIANLLISISNQINNQVRLSFRSWAVQKVTNSFFIWKSNLCIKKHQNGRKILLVFNSPAPVEATASAFHSSVAQTTQFTEMNATKRTGHRSKMLVGHSETPSSGRCWGLRNAINMEEASILPGLPCLCACQIF